MQVPSIHLPEIASECPPFSHLSWKMAGVRSRRGPANPPTRNSMGRNHLKKMNAGICSR